MHDEHDESASHVPVGLKGPTCAQGCAVSESEGIRRGRAKRDLLAQVLSAPDGTRRLVPSCRWELPQLMGDEADSHLWGRDWMPPRGFRHDMRYALRRELALAKLRVRRGRRFDVFQRIPPPRHGDGWRAVVKEQLLQGVLVDVGPPERRQSVLDEIMATMSAAVGLRLDIVNLRVGYLGDVLLEVAGGDGLIAFGRVSAEDTPEPPHAVAAMATLATTAIAPMVPAVLGWGRIGRYTWTLETMLPGTRPKRLQRAVLEQLVRVAGQLPRSGLASTPPLEELELVEALVPERSGSIHMLRSQLQATAERLPGILSHGDFKHANVLALKGAVTGIVDWGLWQDNSMPGLDLLWLHISEEKGRRRLSPMGPLFVEEPWSWDRVLDTSGAYWKTLGVAPDHDVLRQCGLACWVFRVGAALQDYPDLGKNPNWVRENITMVVDKVIASG